MMKQHTATAGQAGAKRPHGSRTLWVFELGKKVFAPALVAAAFVITLGFSVPAQANTSDTTIGVPVVNPVQALPTENVTITVAVTCDDPNGAHDPTHAGCANGVPDSPATEGSVEFFAYLPDGLASCDADPGAPISLGAADNDGTDGWSVTFTPDSAGLNDGEVYFIRIEYTGISGETANSQLNSGCAALATLEVEESGLVQKVLVSGPSQDDDITDVLDPTANPAPNINDDGIIWIGLTVPQYFVYNILIDNDQGIPLVVSDVVGADFDIDERPIDHGVFSDSGDCVVRLSQPPNADNTPKEPEFIDIDVAVDAVCTVEVHVVTVENPGVGNNLFEPTGTRVVGQTAQGSPIDIHDTYTLNEGVKVFDASDGANSGERLLGPVGTLQLTPIFPAP